MAKRQFFGNGSNIINHGVGIEPSLNGGFDKYGIGYGGKNNSSNHLYGYSHVRVGRGSFMADVVAELDVIDNTIKNTLNGYQFRAKELLQEVLYMNVYSYPAIHADRRRYENGGLSDTGNMIFQQKRQVRGVGFNLQDLAAPQGTKATRLDELVEFVNGHPFYEEAEYIMEQEVEALLQDRLSEL